MQALHTTGQVLGGITKALRLALPKLGVGWMAALLTVNFNRVSIVELNIVAVLVTVMLGLHYFLSPFQVVFGRIADRHPIRGYRRTPYLLAASLVASLCFLALPSVALGMSRGSLLFTVIGFGLLIIYGIGIAVMGDSHHALIAEVTSERTRGGVIAVVWTFTIISIIASAIVMREMMPVYEPAAMQRLYNLTPFVVMGATLLGVLGMERRVGKAEQAVQLQRAQAAAPRGNPVQAALTVLRTNTQARNFFAFVFLAILGIFLQDNILEVFGGEVFGMTPAETAGFQPVWGGGALLGMFVMGILSSIFPISKKLIASVGSAGTALGLGMLALTALLGERALLNPSLLLMGFCTGCFNIGALSMMMDMTVEGATGLYMGLWGVAQAFGTGFAAITSGALHTGLIETGLLSPGMAYTVIFGLEAVLMVVSIACLSIVSIHEFKGLTRADVTRAMELGTAS